MRGMNWISMAQDREKERAFVSAAINVGLHKIRGIS
jgi:hypothetical protein